MNHGFDGPPLRQYALMVWRRRTLVLGVALIVTISALGVSLLQTPRYQASGQLLLSRSQLDENFNVTATALSDTQMNNLKSLLTSDQVAMRARATGGTGTVRASSTAGSNALTVIAEAPDPETAARTVGSYFTAYTEYVREQDLRPLESASSSLEDRLSDTRNQLATAPPGQVATIQEQVASLESQLGRVQTQRELAAGGATVLQEPSVPASPVSPVPLRDGLLGLLIGFALGASIAVLIETLSRRPDGEARSPKGVVADVGGAGPNPPVTDRALAPTNGVRGTHLEPTGQPMSRPMSDAEQTARNPQRNQGSQHTTSAEDLRVPVVAGNRVTGSGSASRPPSPRPQA